MRPLRLQRTIHLFGETTMSQEKQLFGTGKAVSIGAVRSLLPRVLHPGGPAPRAGRRGSGRGAAARWEARQIGPYARLEPKGQDSCPPRGENAADGPISRASQRPDPRRRHAGISFLNSPKLFRLTANPCIAFCRQLPKGYFSGSLAGRKECLRKCNAPVVGCTGPNS